MDFVILKIDLAAIKNMLRSRRPTDSVFQQNPESESRKNCRVCFEMTRNIFERFHK